jgi:hypothetical protein
VYVFVAESVNVLVLLSVNPPVPLPIAPEMVTLPDPATVSEFVPLLTAPETVNGLDELFVQVCDAPNATGALIVVVPAPLLTVIPAVELAGVIVSAPLVPAAIPTALPSLKVEPSTVRVLMVYAPSSVVLEALPELFVA